MTCWVQIALLGLALTAVGAEEGATTAFLAKQEQTQEAQEAQEAQSLTASLRVKNDAPVAVNLMSCIENSSPVTVEPGGTKTLALSGVSGMWVVPDGATLDCDKGPFQFFYIATEVEDPKKGLGAFVGFGVEMNGADEQKSNTSEESVDYAALLEAEEKPFDLHGVTGVQLSAGKDGISCTQNFCEADFPVAAPSTGLDLVIQGATTSEAPAYVSLYRWRRRGWGYGRRGWRRGGWGWGRRRWGGGYRRWGGRRMGWWR